MARVIASADERRFRDVTLFGFRLSRSGITPAGRTKPSEDQWTQLGDYLAWAENSTPWLIAAWLEYGEATYGERASQVAEATGFELETIQQYEWVNRKVKPSERVEGLSYSHHRAVANLPAAAQRRILQRAKADRLTVKQVEREVQKLKNPGDTSCWLLVNCRSQRDRDKLIAQMEREGRAVKIP